MKYPILIISFIILSSTVVSQDLKNLNDEQWIADLEQLASSIRLKHVDPFDHITSEEFDTNLNELSKRFNELTLQEKIIELIKLASSIGDGHTVVRSYDQFRLFPIVLYWFGDDLRIIWTNEENEIIAGGKVKKINNIEIHDIKKKVDQLSPHHENDYLLLQWSQHWIRNADVLKFFNIIDSVSEARFLIENDLGVTVDVTLPSYSTYEYTGMKWSSAYDSFPQFMTNKKIPVWTSQPVSNTYYINFHAYPEKNEMKNISKKIVKDLNSSSFERLIIDFRENSGGNMDHGLYLIKQLKKSNFPDNGKVYVITGRKTFSAALANAAHFRDQMNAILIGEPPSQRPNGPSESHVFELDHSKIEASISIEFHQFQDEDTNILKLDEHIPPNYILRKEGRDEVLEWILNQE